MVRVKTGSISAAQRNINAISLWDCSDKSHCDPGRVLSGENSLLVPGYTSSNTKMSNTLDSSEVTVGCETQHETSGD